MNLRRQYRQGARECDRHRCALASNWPPVLISLCSVSEEIDRFHSGRPGSRGVWS